MSIFKEISKGISKTTNFLGGEASKFMNKKMLNAVMGASVYVMFSDGFVRAEEKEKLLGNIKRNKNLKCYTEEEIVEEFASLVDAYEFDSLVATTTIKEKIEAIKKNKKSVDLMLAICISIANADGVFSDKERSAIEEIAKWAEKDTKNLFK